jgi:putative ATPase
MPEARIVLSEATIFLASSAKSNSGYLSIDEALDLVGQTGDLPIPLHLRNAPTKLMKELGYGAEYKYAHNFEGHFVTDEYMPKELSGRKFYSPQDNPREKEMGAHLNKLWKGKYGY